MKKLPFICFFNSSNCTSNDWFFFVCNWILVSSSVCCFDNLLLLLKFVVMDGCASSFPMLHPYCNCKASNCADLASMVRCFAVSSCLASFTCWSTRFFSLTTHVSMIERDWSSVARSWDVKVAVDDELENDDDGRCVSVVALDNRLIFKQCCKFWYLVPGTLL